LSESEPRYLPLGDSAITIVVGEAISREVSAEVMRLRRTVIDSNIDGVLDVVPSYATLTAYYDPIRVQYDLMASRLHNVIAAARDGRAGSPADEKKGRTVRIPVRYDGEDLAEVAARTGLTHDRIVELHAAREYHVYVIGFVPGFAYLGELDDALVLSRRATPRKRVPAGSVAIAEAQTGIYPFSTPGGWHLIGTTSTRMFDQSAAEPALLSVGDTVIFDPIG
jgi:KipI family sensor histidine kinase inhibitor